jgi:CBS domain containing-hemolysin-like protein
MSSSDQSAAGGDRPGLFDRLKSLFGFQGPSIREDIEDALEEATPGADISPQERLLLKNVLNLHDLRVADIMVPRADIISVKDDATLGEVLSIFRTAGHSRLPVYRDTLDDPRGMIHIRDFVDYMARAAENRTRLRINSAVETKPELAKLAGLSGIDLNVPISAARILRPVLFTPPSMPALDLLVRMQAMRTHIALVIDEYGGTDGLVSIEDIVETIVGDIEDEHDFDETPVIERQADGSFIMDARASLEEVREALGDTLELELEEEIDTIGGLVSTLAGQLPARGEIVRISDTLECEVLDADPRRVKRVRLRKTDSAPGV